MRLIDADVSIEKLKSLPIELDAKTIQRCIEVLSNMSSADRPSGEWLARDCVFGVVYCSECGYELRQNDTNYCPNCGCRMKGADDG